MENKRLGALAGVVGALALAAQTLPGMIVSRWIAAGPRFPTWAPTFGTAGETAVVYRSLTETAGPLVTLALAVGLGYYVGRRLDLAREYRRFVGTVSIGSTIGVGIAWAALVWYGGTAPTGAGDALLLLATLAQQFVAVALVVAAGAIAGAALGYFRARDRRPRRPAESADPSPVERGDRSTRDTHRG
jgi:hypothetical protein